MIALYDFDSANVNGDKEAVIVPNVPTLVNKLSASETNGIRDKINEIISLVNVASPTAYLDLDLIAKGEQGGVANTGAGLEVGDIVRGFKEQGIFWEAAQYTGGDPTDRANYLPFIPNTMPPQTFTAVATGPGQQFILPVGFTAVNVFKSRGLLYIGSEWTQTDDVLTILINTNIGNTIYVTT